MVVVLPWHDPLRVAEQVSMLDHISDGRLILGIGRGSGGRVRGLPLSDGRVARALRRVAREMILRGLETGYCEYDGKLS